VQNNPKTFFHNLSLHDHEQIQPSHTFKLNQHLKLQNNSYFYQSNMINHQNNKSKNENQDTIKITRTRLGFTHFAFEEKGA